MVVVQETRCESCGLCVEICHEGCMVLGTSGPIIDHELCSTCTQCISICPCRALTWDGAKPVPFDRNRLPSAEQLDELLKERRTIRRFKSEAIENELIEEIVSYGIHAPTNNFDLRIVVVTDRCLIRDLDAIIIAYVAKIYNLIYRSKVVFRLVQALTPGLKEQDKVKMEHDLVRGRTYDTLPSAVVFIVGDRRVALSGDSAQYALYNMILYAQAIGVGSRLKGTGQIFLDRSRAARKELGLRQHEHILGTLELGYPALRFSNKVVGKTMPIAWHSQA
jgi:nitroreductase/NAD-dependent dihydropyrimidine dehydrogenase PreA subunit